MGGHDIYSSSKACSEILSHSYRKSFLEEPNAFLLATCRAGNVIGGGDWALDRLIPDCIRAINASKKIEIRNPLAVRPWQHVLEPLSGYLLLGEKLLKDGRKYAESFNFGPDENSILEVSEVCKKVIEYYGRGNMFIKKKDDMHEAGLLMLNIDKALNILDWRPVYSIDKAIEQTVEWYKRFYNNEDMYEYSIKQIEEYYEVYRA